ncbi:MAG: glucose-6-phosphate isomerase [Candidatus Acidiferrales bacterium]
MPVQHIHVGALGDAWRAEVERLAAAQTIEHIWAKKPEIWKKEPEHQRVIANRLGWLDSIAPMQKAVGQIAAFAREVRSAGYRDIVLLGMGGSSLAPEVFSLTFPASGPGRLFVLDSTDPASVLGVERAVDPRSTLFVVASKSGKTIETLSQFEYFLRRLEAAGVSPPGKNFIAITDKNSQLEIQAERNKFRRTFLNPADIGGRYSALSYFGLVPAALWGVDLIALLESAAAMSEACGPGATPPSNPALTLGALMGVGAQQGRDKLFLLAEPALASLGNWIEQLVAESTGKEGKGVIPIAGEQPGAPEIFDRGIVAMLALDGHERAAFGALAKQLEARGTPVVDIRLRGRDELGGEFFKWEVATAVAGVTLGINPFDEPNVQESKDNTARILQWFQSNGTMPVSEPRVKDAGIELHAQGSAHNRAFGSRVAQVLRAFLKDRDPRDYLALLAYLDRNAANSATLEAMRTTLRDHLKMPVLLGFGPRLLHSIGQLYKGGPPSGMFLQITAADAQDVPVPTQPFTFGQLKMAQALGDLESLATRHKPALRLHLTQGAAAGLEQLRQAISEALGT